MPINSAALRQQIHTQMKERVHALLSPDEATQVIVAMNGAVPSFSGPEEIVKKLLARMGGSDTPLSSASQPPQSPPAPPSEPK